ncbi:hypothetical protein J7E95_16905 [Streptomyces sp. ISL-14]|nr:hypothetical protein [Streptomyces sp. ISL-14]
MIVIIQKRGRPNHPDAKFSLLSKKKKLGKQHELDVGVERSLIKSGLSLKYVFPPYSSFFINNNSRKSSISREVFAECWTLLNGALLKDS